MIKYLFILLFLFVDKNKAFLQFLVFAFFIKVANAKQVVDVKEDKYQEC